MDQQENIATCPVNWACGDIFSSFQKSSNQINALDTSLKYLSDCQKPFFLTLLWEGIIATCPVRFFTGQVAIIPFRLNKQDYILYQSTP